MIRKVMIGAALMLGIVTLGLAAPAAAAPIDYAGCSLSVNPFLVQSGTNVALTGSGYEPNLVADIVLDRGLPGQQVVGSVTADAIGSFVDSFIVPANAGPGQHSVSVQCSTDPNVGFGNSNVLVDSTTVDLSLSDTVVQRQEVFTATVTGAGAGTPVEFAQLSTRVVVGSVVANANGVATLRMSFPATAELGAHQVEARGVDRLGKPFVLADPIQVVAAGARTVPRTGSDVGPMALAGGGAVLVGAVLVTVARRRRATASA